jgi:hypothetical protein
VKKTIKYSLIGIAGIIGLLTTIGIIGAIAGVDTKPETKPVAQAPAVAAQPTKPVEKKTTPAPKPVQTTKAPASKEDIFLAVMRRKFPQLNNTKDSVLLKAGHSVCELFKDGYTFEEIAYTAVDSGMTPEQAGYLMGASTAAFCPEYSNKEDS